MRYQILYSLFLTVAAVIAAPPSERSTLLAPDADLEIRELSARGKPRTWDCHGEIIIAEVVDRAVASGKWCASKEYPDRCKEGDQYMSSKTFNKKGEFMIVTTTGKLLPHAMFKISYKGEGYRGDDRWVVLNNELKYLGLIWVDKGSALLQAFEEKSELYRRCKPI